MINKVVCIVEVLFINMVVNDGFELIFRVVNFVYFYVNFIWMVLESVFFKFVNFVFLKV